MTFYWSFLANNFFLACRLVFGLKKRDSVEEKLKSLHWLKVKERIEFKLCLLIFKAVNGVAPAYLCDLVTFVSSSSRRTSSLHLPVGSTRSHPRAFQTIAPKIWNQLPIEIKTCSDVDLFKTLLKTHLFKKSYGMSD